MMRLYSLLLVLSTVSAYPVPLIKTAIGAVAGGTGALASYPLDYVRTQLQLEEAVYGNGWEAAVHILRTQGPAALYRGSLVNALATGPEKAIKLTVNEAVRGALTVGGSIPVLGEVAAGASAGFCQVAVTNPLEVVKVRMQTSTGSLSQIWQDIGSPAGLYTGATACIARDVVFSAILFPLYAHLKVMGAHVDILADQPFVAGILAGSLAAAPAAVLATPMDVVKTRLQAAREESTTVSSSSSTTTTTTTTTNDDEESNFCAVLNSVVEEEGVPALFAGWLERVSKSVPQFGVTLATVEALTDFCVKQHWI